MSNFEDLVKQLDEAKAALDQFQAEHSDVIDQYKAMDNEVNQCIAAMKDFAKDELEPPQSELYSIRLVTRKTYSADLFEIKFPLIADQVLVRKTEVSAPKLSKAIKDGLLTEADLEGTYVSSAYYLVKSRNNDLDNITI